MILTFSQADAVLTSAAALNNVGGLAITMTIPKGENQVSVNVRFDGAPTITVREYTIPFSVVAEESYNFMVDFANAYGFQ